MGDKTPRVAFCEEFDEVANAVVPESRRDACSSSITNPRFQPDPNASSSAVVAAMTGSDSGSSNRTAATANSGSTPSVLSGRKSPIAAKKSNTVHAHTVDDEKSGLVDGRRGNNNKKFTTTVVDSGLRRAASSSSARRDRHLSLHADDDMAHTNKAARSGVAPQTTTVPSSSSSSSSRQRRRERETTYPRHYPGSCWECEQGLYHHTSTPVEPFPVDYSSVYYTPIVEFAPVAQDHVVSRNPSTRGRRSAATASYGSRRASFHGAIPNMDMVYDLSQMGQYDQTLMPYAYADPSAAPYYASVQPRYSEYGGRSSSKTSDHSRSRPSSLYGGFEHDPSMLLYEEREPIHSSSHDRRRSRRGALVIVTRILTACHRRPARQRNSRGRRYPARASSSNHRRLESRIPPPLAPPPPGPITCRSWMLRCPARRAMVAFDAYRRCASCQSAATAHRTHHRGDDTRGVRRGRER